MRATWRVNIKDEHGNDVPVEVDGEIDEVVIDGWFHLEKMTDNTWWIRIGKHAFEIDTSKTVPRVDVDLDRY